MDLSEYRKNDSEQQRTEDLMQHITRISGDGKSALDIGARDGHFSILLTEFFDKVTALDLLKPNISSSRITCVQGDITNLDFDDNTFDLVFCAEVLEHIPPHLLEKAASELSRVTREFLLIGVPYKQDIRIGRTTCSSCGGKGPPWGHVNSFDENELISLFPLLTTNKVTFVGETDARTNFMSVFFMDIAGNPYGTYNQEEKCIHCGKKLKSPPERTLFQKIFTRVAFHLKNLQKPFNRPHPNWIHILFHKTKV
ncbi:class I SAM-dependent methyltransferase [Marinobacter sp. SS8-8]|uniref:class I SAM-dependent methyltransferase n=1 Tax=Marinobacter sp. SS8-8 TaxID=3050452 RepID=UPI0026E0633D|nr:class I SAM-dependent methyltransferase [Marinobacter sp. SS8-8]